MQTVKVQYGRKMRENTKIQHGTEAEKGCIYSAEVDLKDRETAYFKVSR